MNDLPGYSAEELRGVAVLWKKAKRELPVRFGGNSMRPTIAPGDEVLLQCTDDVSVGDVIVFVYLDRVVVHRLVARGVTRGDAHTVPDRPLGGAPIIGKIVGVAAPPRSIGRSVALAVVRFASLFGARPVALAIGLMQWFSAARRW